jgi:hypothetical protein
LFAKIIFSLTLLICQCATVDNNVYVTPSNEEQCEPSTSEKEDGKKYSAISAKQCSANEAKRISKKFPEVKVKLSYSPLWILGYYQTDSLWGSILQQLINETLCFLSLLLVLLLNIQGRR